MDLDWAEINASYGGPGDSEDSRSTVVTIEGSRRQVHSVVVDRTGGLALATRWAAHGRVVQSAPDLTRSFLRNQADDIAAMYMFASSRFGCST
jgi:hypothetical protein